jgi:NAD(P)-dependent dehydrogenase (short-subunit alcohol dehydrogenase family)
MKIEELFSVTGKTAVVTGGSRGIGEMITRGLIANGAHVIITSRKASDCAALAAELGPACIPLAADLSQMAEIERFAAEVAARMPKLDILFNNAGASWGAPIDSFPELGWDKVIDLNVKSVFFLTQKLLPQLEAAGAAGKPAKVINIGSIDGQHVSDLETYSYAASKAGVLHMTKMMAKFLGRRHITANAIAPGFFPSKMTGAIPEEFREGVRLATPLKRWAMRRTWPVSRCSWPAGPVTS